MGEWMDLHFSNPLSTRYVAPGRLPWIGHASDTIEQLADRFQQFEHRCQILGPHGSGKSTLLEHLVPQLGKVIFRQSPTAVILGSCDQLQLSSTDCSSIVWLTLRRRCTVMSSLAAIQRNRYFRGTLVIDGAEQLNWWQRRRLCRWSLKQQCRLLVTAHRDLGLRTLYQTDVTPQLASRVLTAAMQKAADDHHGLVASPHWNSHSVWQAVDWDALLKKHQGNLRECFMELYDRIEVLYRERLTHDR